MKGKKIKRKISVVLLVVMMLFGSFGNSVFAEEINPADNPEQNLVQSGPELMTLPTTANITLKKRYEEKPSQRAIIKLDGVVWNPTSPTSDTYQADLKINQEYEISEIAPAGFAGVTAFKVKFVRHEGHVRLESVGELPAGVSITSGDHLEIFNTLSEREFKFEKKFEKINGEYPKTFPDFTITYPDGSNAVYSSTDGKYDNVVLKIGDNTFTESNVPAGYENIGSFVITMDRDGDLSSSDLPEGVIISNRFDQILVINTVIERDVQLVKTYEGKHETDAKFYVNKEKLHQHDGVYEKIEFKYGINYTFSETNVPEGYEGVSDFVLTLDGQGNLISVGDLPAGVTIDGMTVNVFNKFITKEINILKIDGEGEELSGASFTINGDEMRVSEGGDRFSADINNVITYTISETAPLGYIGVPDFTIQLNSDRTALEAVGELPDGITIDGLVITVENAIKTNTAILIKTDGEELLSGAEFTFNDVEADVDEDGSEFTLEVQCGIIYTVHESVVPVGYIGVPDFQVKLCECGQHLVPVNNETLAASSHEILPDGVSIDGMTITVANTLLTNTMTITKTDGKNLLAGSMFTISDLTVVADEAGSVFSALIEHGTVYTVHESIVPTGYTGVADFQVKLSDDGQSLVAVDSLPSGVTIDGMNITVANTLIPIPKDPTIPATGDNFTLPIMLLLLTASGFATMYVIKKRKDLTEL